MNSFFKSTLPLMSLCLLVACGSSNSGSSNAGPEFTQNETIQADGSNISGAYVAELYPMNYNLHFKQVGLVGVNREGDSFKASVRLKYGPKSTSHIQAIYTGRRCPGISDDLNKDAFIDMNEALIAIGKITIPLDSNLDAQTEGGSQYPVGDEKGKYFYEAQASFERMFADLKTEDTDPSDNIIKLEANEGLTFPGRVVLIQGVSESMKLPATVKAPEGLDIHKSLPVACGIIWKVKEMPAELMPGSEASTNF